MRIKPVIPILCLSLFLAAEQQPLSPSGIAISQGGSQLYIACATDDSIQVFDVGKESVSARFDAEGVRQIALSGDNAGFMPSAGISRADCSS